MKQQPDLFQAPLLKKSARKEPAKKEPDKNVCRICLWDRADVYNLGIADLFKSRSDLRFENCKSLIQFYRKHKSEPFQVLIIHLYPELDPYKVRSIIAKFISNGNKCRVVFYFHDYVHELFEEISTIKKFSFFQMDDNPEEISRVIGSNPANVETVSLSAQTTEWFNLTVQKKQERSYQLSLTRQEVTALRALLSKRKRAVLPKTRYNFANIITGELGDNMEGLERIRVKLALIPEIQNA